MATTNDKRRRPAKTREHQIGTIPVLRVKKGASLKAIYTAARRAFTAADLQKYTEIEEGTPARQVLADLEAIDQEEARKRRREARRSGRCHPTHRHLD